MNRPTLADRASLIMLPIQSDIFIKAPTSAPLLHGTADAMRECLIQKIAWTKQDGRLVMSWRF